MNLIHAFPIGAIIISILAWFQPELFLSGKTFIIPLLALVMFGMGLSLKFTDFTRALRMPKLIGIGMILQFSVMPLLAISISHLLSLETLLLVGMILLGSSPGGTASNVICYLSGGNVALSITLTAFSTILATIFTPLVTLLALEETIEVPAIAMFLSILKIIATPVLLGLILNHFFHRQLRPLIHWFPLISMASIIYIMAIIVALNVDQIRQISLILILAVILHNGLGLLFGYYGARFIGYSKAEWRTIAIEVGMQNSGLAVALAIKYFPALTALPAALFSIWHNISGSLLAAAWAKEKSQAHK